MLGVEGYGIDWIEVVYSISFESMAFEDVIFRLNFRALVQKLNSDFALNTGNRKSIATGKALDASRLVFQRRVSNLRRDNKFEFDR